MNNLILDFQKLKKFNDEKPHKEELWTGDSSRINLISLQPGQEIRAHIHEGDHIWIILEGRGNFLSSEQEARVVGEGIIVIVPAGGEHGISNTTKENLVFASITV